MVWFGLGRLFADPVRQRGQDRNSNGVNGSGLGPAVAPALPARCSMGLCAAAVLQNPLHAMPADDHPPAVVQTGDNSVVQGRSRGNAPCDSARQRMPACAVVNCR
jgi:hypothetical protein